MTIRIQLSLWYSAVLFLSLLICSALLYREWILEPRRQRPASGISNEDSFDDLAESFAWSALPAIVLGCGGGWLLMRKALAPITALTEAAERMTENNLNVQLNRSHSGDELDRLTEVFNRMALRMADSFQRIREFTLRASHELKTPLTIMRGGVETALTEQPLSSEQREHLLDHLDEIDRLTRLVDGLTLLTKADAGLVAWKQASVRLHDLVRDTYADGQLLARPFQVEVSLSRCDEAVVRGDADRLRQMLLNLVDNAVKYNSPKGTVAVALSRHGGSADVEITNTGPGVSPNLLPHIFEPFFRGEETRSSSAEGCGLGLAIVRRIVTAHEGTIDLTSSDGETRVAVRLPLAPGIRKVDLTESQLD